MWKRVIDSQAEKLKELDKEIRPFRQNWEEADSMKSSVESLQNRVSELESVDKCAGQAARNTGEHSQAGPGGPRVPGCAPGECCAQELLGGSGECCSSPGLSGYRAVLQRNADLPSLLGWRGATEPLPGRR